MKMDIRLENVEKYYGKKLILQQVTLKLLEQELVMVLGPNGAGKSTLLKLMAGLVLPDHGKISYNGIPLDKIPIKKRATLFSYIPQENGNLPSYTVREFILLGLAPYYHFLEFSKKEEEERLLRAMEQFSLTPLQHQRITAISGGERRLCYLARAMLQRADVLFMDEPTAALDFQRQHQFFAVLKKYLHTENKGAIVSVHDPNLALRYADKIILLHKNQIFARFRRESPAFSVDFFAALNQIYQEKLALLSTEKSQLIYWKEE